AGRIGCQHLFRWRAGLQRKTSAASRSQASQGRQEIACSRKEERANHPQSFETKFGRTGTHFEHFRKRRINCAEAASAGHGLGFETGVAVSHSHATDQRELASVPPSRERTAKRSSHGREFPR